MVILAKNEQANNLVALIWYGDDLPINGTVTTASAHHRISGPTALVGAVPPGGGPSGLEPTAPAALAWIGDINGDGLNDLCWADPVTGDGAFEVLWDDSAN